MENGLVSVHKRTSSIGSSQASKPLSEGRSFLFERSRVSVLTLDVRRASRQQLTCKVTDRLVRLHVCASCTTHAPLSRISRSDSPSLPSTWRCFGCPGSLFSFSLYVHQTCRSSITRYFWTPGEPAIITSKPCLRAPSGHYDTCSATFSIHLVRD